MIPMGFKPITFILAHALVLVIFVIMGVFDTDKHENLLGITNLDELYEIEALGVLRAQQYMLDLDTAFIFDGRLILDVHQIVFGGLYSWAGKWRTIETNIGIETTKIPYAIAEYADHVNYLKNKIKDRTDLIHCLSFTHHRYTQIHPFNNGNGRTARLITDLVANMNGYQNVQLYVRESNAERDNYRNALKAADSYDDFLLKKMIGERLIPFG
jgi:cell filamentation protein